MGFAKGLMLFSGLTILLSTAAFEWATFSELTYVYQVPPLAMIAGLVGLAAWLVGSVMICGRVPASTLLSAGLLMLIFLPLCISMLSHLSPVFFNVHGGMGGFFAPVAACLLSGALFILAGIVRLGRD